MDVLDTLFSLLPVAFAVIWIMSRVGRGRKNRRDSPGKPSGNGAGDAEERRKTQKAPASGSLAEWVAEKARQARAAAAKTEDGEKVSRGEDELYARLENRRVESGGNRTEAPQAPVVSTTRVVDDIVSSPYEKEEAGGGASSALDRIAELPPLARGIVWSVILDEPPSLKGPPER